MARYGHDFWNRFWGSGTLQGGNRYDRTYRGRPGGPARGWSYGGDYRADFGRGRWEDRNRDPNHFEGGMPEYYSGTYRRHGTIGESPAPGGTVYPEPPEHRFRASRGPDFYRRRGR